MQFGALSVEFSEQTGSIEISYNEEIILKKLSPVLYYGDDWLAEDSGEIIFNQISLEQKAGFEANLDFPEYYDLKKVYTVKHETGDFQVTVHAYIFPDHSAIYVMGEINGNDAKSDAIGGLIDVGEPQNLSGYRFFHTGDKKVPFVVDNPTTQIGMAFFVARENPWEEPCYTDNLPNNEAMPINYMIGKSSKGFVAFVPVSRFGQITLIHSCNFLEIPLGLKFVSGNFLVAQQYQQLAGGLIGFGRDPLQLTESIYRTYMQLMKRTQALRVTKDYPEPFNYIGFCTWNTFYSSVDEQGVKDLAEENFTAKTGSDRFRYLILDDGWQAINGLSCIGDNDSGSYKSPRALRRFEANQKFPTGLRNVIDLLKSQYGLKWFGVWHAVTGYWSGTEPISELGQKYAIKLNKFIGFPDPHDYKAYNFWIDYYKYIRNQGVDLLKIDNQCSLSVAMEGVYSPDDHIDQYYDMQQGAAYSQNLKILNCMAMCSFNYVHWKVSNVSRVSDDFAPGNKPGLKRQIRQCTFNPLFFGQFCWPDHDMLQSKPGHNGCPVWSLALIHMASGGPVYFADEVGETDGNVIAKLSFPDGKLPRLDTVGMPTVDALFGDNMTEYPCKFWNYHDLAGWGRLFYSFAANMVEEEKPISAHLTLSDFGANKEVKTSLSETFSTTPTEYVIKDTESAFTKEIQSETEGIDVEIANMEAKYFVISPVISGIALFGIKEVLNGPKAIQSISRISEQTIAIEMAYPGTLEYYKKDGVVVIVKSPDGTELTPIVSEENPNLFQIPAEKIIVFQFE